MDDARVSLVSTQEVLSSEAYMLFYRVVDHPYSKKLASQVKSLNELYEVVASEAKKQKKVASTPKENREKRSFMTVEADTSAIMARPPVCVEGKRNLGDSFPPKIVSSGSSATGRSLISTPAATVKRNPRKRRAPEYTCVEEWARSMTVLTQKNISKLCEAERKITKHIRFTPEFHELLSEYARGSDTRAGHISGINTLDDCGIECKKDINITLLRCFLAISKNDGIVDFTSSPTPKMITRSSAASRVAKVQSSIHVFNSTDNFL